MKDLNKKNFECVIKSGVYYYNATKLFKYLYDDHGYSKWYKILYKLNKNNHLIEFKNIKSHRYNNFYDKQSLINIVTKLLKDNKKEIKSLIDSYCENCIKVSGRDLSYSFYNQEIAGAEWSNFMRIWDNAYKLANSL